MSGLLRSKSQSCTGASYRLQCVAYVYPSLHIVAWCERTTSFLYRQLLRRAPSDTFLKNVMVQFITCGPKARARCNRAARWADSAMTLRWILEWKNKSEPMRFLSDPCSSTMHCHNGACSAYDGLRVSVACIRYMFSLFTHARALFMTSEWELHSFVTCILWISLCSGLAESVTNQIPKRPAAKASCLPCTPHLISTCDPLFKPLIRCPQPEFPTYSLKIWYK